MLVSMTEGKRTLENLAWHLNALVWTSLVAQMIKNPPAMQETWVWSLGLENPLENGMATTPVFLPGESHGQRSLAGCSLWDRKESITTERVALGGDTHHFLSQLIDQTSSQGYIPHHVHVLNERGAGNTGCEHQRLPYTLAWVTVTGLPGQLAARSPGVASLLAILFTTVSDFLLMNLRAHCSYARS